jgi:hypothetical protein
VTLTKKEQDMGFLQIRLVSELHLPAMGQLKTHLYKRHPRCYNIRRNQAELEPMKYLFHKKYRSKGFCFPNLIVREEELNDQ